MAKVRSFTDAVRKDAFDVFPSDLCIIGGKALPENMRGPYDTDDGPEHPLYDKRIFDPIDEKRLARTREYGVFDVIKTQKIPNIDVPVVLNGKHRTIYARIVNAEHARAGEELKRVPVSAPLNAKGGYDAKRSQSIMVLSNELTNVDSMSARAANAIRLHNEPFNRSPQEIADMYLVSLATAYQWLKLENMAPAVKEALDSGELKGSGAAALASKPHEEQVVELEKLRAKAPKDGKRAGKISTGAAVQSKRASGNEETVNATAYGKRVWRAIVDHEKAGELDPGFIKGLRFCLQEKVTLAGLTAILKDVVGE